MDPALTMQQGEGSSETLEPPAATRVIAQQLTNTKFCKHHLRGFCRYGSRCGYAHGATELLTRPNLWKTKFCVNFRSGSCMVADCSYAHGLADLRRAKPTNSQGPFASFSMGEFDDIDFADVDDQFSLLSRGARSRTMDVLPGFSSSASGLSLGGVESYDQLARLQGALKGRSMDNLPVFSSLQEGPSQNRANGDLAPMERPPLSVGGRQGSAHAMAQAIAGGDLGNLASSGHLGRNGTKAVAAQDVSEGTMMVSVRQLHVFAALGSLTVIEHLPPGREVIASGPPQIFQGSSGFATMIPIKPRGFINAAYVKISSASSYSGSVRASRADETRMRSQEEQPRADDDLRDLLQRAVVMSGGPLSRDHLPEFSDFQGIRSQPGDSRSGSGIPHGGNTSLPFMTQGSTPSQHQSLRSDGLPQADHLRGAGSRDIPAFHESSLQDLPIFEESSHQELSHAQTRLQAANRNSNGPIAGGNSWHNQTHMMAGVSKSLGCLPAFQPQSRPAATMRRGVPDAQHSSTMDSNDVLRQAVWDGGSGSTSNLSDEEAVQALQLAMAQLLQNEQAPSSVSPSQDSARASIQQAMGMVARQALDQLKVLHQANQQILGIPPQSLGQQALGQQAVGPQALRQQDQTLGGAQQSQTQALLEFQGL